jgi:hypothetical protein
MCAVSLQVLYHHPSLPFFELEFRSLAHMAYIGFSECEKVRFHGFLASLVPSSMRVSEP